MCVYACSEIDGEASILLVYHFETRTDKEMFYEYEIHRQVFFSKKWTASRNSARKCTLTSGLNSHTS